MKWLISGSSLGFLFIHYCIFFLAFLDSTQSQPEGHNFRHKPRSILEAHSPLEDSLRRFRDVSTPSDRASTARSNDYYDNNETAAESTAVTTQVVECYLQSWSEAHQGAQGLIEITVRHDLSPAKAAQFVALAASGYYDGVFVFRVLKGFVAQFGLRPQWAGWSGPKFKRVQEPNPLPLNALSNTRGTVAFAGGSPTQVFINLGANQRLDGDGRPFATIDEASMAAVDRLYTEYKDGDGQVGAVTRGQEEVRRRFPNMSWIESCHLRGTPAKEVVSPRSGSGRSKIR